MCHNLLNISVVFNQRHFCSNRFKKRGYPRQELFRWREREIYLEYEVCRKEMRGSPDQTAMNNKHIKRFHFSISPPRSIRSGAADSFSSDDQINAFQNRHLARLCLNCCHMQLRHCPTITFVLFLVQWENFGLILLLPANLILQQVSLSKPSPRSPLCLNCCHMQMHLCHRPTITFVISSVLWEHFGRILLLPANLILLRHFPFLSPSLSFSIW